MSRWCGAVNNLGDAASAAIAKALETNTTLHALYLVQTAIWIATCFSHQFLEQRHKDYVMMYLHHLVTIALLLLSYSWGYLPIGAMVLLWRDPAGNKEGPARTSPP